MGVITSQAALRPAIADQLTDRQEVIAGKVLHGWSQRRIAKHIGISQAMVSKEMVKVRAIWRQEMSKSYDDHVAQHTARYRQLSEALQPMIDSGDWKSIDTAIRLEDRVARLLGLDMPQQVEIHVTVEEIDKEINRLRAKIYDAEIVDDSANIPLELEA